jgi:hypothetical protein
MCNATLFSSRPHALKSKGKAGRGGAKFERKKNAPPCEGAHHAPRAEDNGREPATHGSRLTGVESGVRGWSHSSRPKNTRE